MSADGTWNVILKTPMGEQSAVLTIETSGAAVTGRLDSAMGSIIINEGTVDGDNITWTAEMTAPMPMTVEFTGVVDGDSISGEAKMGAFGTAPLTGTRG